jgi:lysophospholipase L1-like esterase
MLPRLKLTLTTLLILALAGCGGGGSGQPTGAGGSGGSGQPTSPDGGADAGNPRMGVVAAGVRWVGRVDTTTPTAPNFGWSGTGFIAQFSGTGLSAAISVTDSTEIYYFKSVIDGAPQTAFMVPSPGGTYVLASGLAAGTHTVELYRQTEGGEGTATLTGLTVADGTLLDPPSGPARLIEVVGDSITCGYGTLGALADTDCFPTESVWDAWGSVAARSLGAEVSTICASGRGVVQNYDGSTIGTVPLLYPLTLANSDTPVWDFHIQPDVVVINLGTNDVNKGDPGTAFTQTYQTFLQTIRANYPDAYIIAIIGPLLSGGNLTLIEGYIQAAVQAQNAAGDSRVEFFDQIQSQPTSAFACQYHPNPTEQTLMGTQVATEIAAKLGW